MRGARAQWLALVLFAAGAVSACAALDEGAVFSESQVVRAYVTWLEAERRRDPELAREVLYFRSGEDEERLEEELAVLEGVPGGTIRTESEIHLVGYPPGWGPGEYLFLVPDGERFVPARAAVVGRGGKAFIVYEPPALTVEERRELSPPDQARQALRARIDRLKRLEGKRLAAEIDRVRTALRYQAQAAEYAARHDLPLASFSEDPAALLSEVASLGDEAARDWLVARLAAALAASPR